MANNEATNTILQLQDNTQSNMEPANFRQSIWGDCFLSFSLDNSQLEAYFKAIEEQKKQVKRLLSSRAIDFDEKLSLIYSVYRLGLTYLFTKEIDRQIDRLVKKLNMESYNEADLYTISIHFQVFRIFGHRFSCDVFDQFKDCSSGEFKEDISTNVRGMISFYESAQLRIRGESILDEAIVFTKTKLKALEKTLQGTLARKVKHALERPLHRGHPMVEARQYLLNYEEDISRYDSLLKLAKVHFNYLQLLQKEELRVVSKWWKDLTLQVKTYNVKDRIPELYVWILALFSEPYYSQARIIATKIIQLVSMLHDTYAYARIGEIRLLTHAINRWNVSIMSQLPESIKPFYEILLSEFAELHNQLPQEGTTNLMINALKKSFRELARGYLQEAGWRHRKEVPSFEEYMRIGLTTSTHELLGLSAWIGMGQIVTQKAFTWYQSNPEMLTASKIIARLHNDLMTFEFKRERAPTTTVVDAYMKTFGVSECVAVEALKELVEDAWKDINEGCLLPRWVPMDLLSPIANLARMVDVAYDYNEGLTFPEYILKEYITLLFFVSIPM